MWKVFFIKTYNCVMIKKFHTTNAVVSYQISLILKTVHIHFTFLLSKMDMNSYLNMKLAFFKIRI